MKPTKTLISFCAAALMLFSSFTAEDPKAKLVEKVEKTGDELCIPYVRYELPNGLNLIIHEDHSDPIVHVDVTYHVGSAREQEGRSGFAHFFEHMMFQGSDHVENGQHSTLVTEAGGSMNGSTTGDRTNYFETLPSNQLETALWLEADRMGFLLDAVTQQKFEVQRGTVKNERGQRYDNRPYGLVEEKTVAALYPLGHPYSWPTIGFIEDLNRVDVNDLKKFFMRWYGPNNAVITVAGDVKPETVIALVEKYFGSIPRGVEVKRMPKMPAVLDKDRYITNFDRIRNPQLNISWPGVEEGNKDELALEALCDVLSNGKNSIMYQKFINTQVAGRALMLHDGNELSGMVRLSITAFPGKTLAQIDSMIKVTFTEFEKRGVKEEDVLKFKNSLEVELINSLSSVRGKASILAHNYTMLGNANALSLKSAELKKLTKEDVWRVYEKYIKGKPAVYLSVCPQGHPELAAAPDNFVPPVRNTTAPEAAEYKNLSYHKPQDNFDRKTQPTPGPVPMAPVPDFWKERFDNDLHLIGVRNDEVPMTTITLALEAGHRQEDPSNAGISNLCAMMLNEMSTTKNNGEVINDKLDMLGSDLTFTSTRDELVLKITALTKNLPATLDIVKEILYTPKFDSLEFQKDKNQSLQAIANNATQPDAIATNVYNKLIYGEKNILSVPTLGTTASVKSITLADLRNFYFGHLAPSICKVVVVANEDKETVISQLAFLKELKSQTVVLRPQMPDRPNGKRLKIYLVNKEKAAQSVVRMGETTGLLFDPSGEYFKASAMNYVLGVDFNSRINHDLREVKYYTYGAGSQFGSDRYNGVFTIFAPVRTNATDSTLLDLVDIVGTYRNKGITAAELSFTQKSMSLGEVMNYETPRQKSDFLKRIQDYNLDRDYVKRQTEILNKMTVADVNALAKKYLSTDQMLILVVGDKKEVYSKLQKLGYDIIELDTDGNVIPPPSTESVPLQLKDTTGPRK